MLTGCAAAPLDQAGSLSSYDGLVPADGVLTHARLRVSKDDVLAAKTARIVPTVFAETAGGAALSDKQRGLITNALDRSLCLGLSERFTVVAPSDTADLTVHAVITHVLPTDAAVAGVSKVASVAPSILLPGVPVPVPRIPIGLGSLSVEAEARDRNGSQKAAMIWGLGANSFTSAPRVSSDADAYELAAAFSGDFSKLLVTGTSPMGKLPSLPSMQRIGTFFGAAPKDAACATFGRDPGLVGLLANRIGTPPDWADSGSPPTSPPGQSVASSPN